MMKSPFKKVVHVYLHYTLFWECFGINYLESNAYGNVYHIKTDLYQNYLFIHSTNVIEYHPFLLLQVGALSSYRGDLFYEMSWLHS